MIKGISLFLSPLSIVKGTILDYELYFKAILREFMQTYKDTNNIMKVRTVDAIAFGSNRNLQEGIQYFSLETWKCLQRA